jgi:hypothetical protein
MILPQNAIPSLRKSMRPSASPLRGICHSRRIIGDDDTTFPRPPQAGSWEIEVSRAVWDVNAQDATYEAATLFAFSAGCFRCWEIRRSGVSEKIIKILQAS